MLMAPLILLLTLIMNDLSDIDYIVNAWRSHLIEDPSRICLSDGIDGDFTRLEVETLSNRVNAWLHERGIGKEDMVLINLYRGIKPVIAVLGVWKAGAAFTIVEADSAIERIESIRHDSGAKVEIDEKAWKEILNSKPLEEVASPDFHDLCLMVYTSGTTGKPKGVVHEYGQLVLEMLSERREDGSFRETPTSSWALVAPLNFVASIKFIIHFCYSGGHLFIVDYDTVKNQRKLNAFLLKNRIEGVFISPSLMRMKKSGYGPFIKYIYVGAEPANNLFIEGPELGNTYTMSESLFTVSKFILDKAYPIAPIGAPTFNLKIKLLDECGEESSTKGELCFENPYCRGYINNPVETNQHFIDGYYHTGDLAEFKDGLYFIKGRLDDMVKINGNRIEPGEIEAVCREEMGISDCVAKAFIDRGIVVLYYTQACKFDKKLLYARLAKRLPYYMVPTHFVHIDKYPLTDSAKVDRRALQLPAELTKEEYAPPRNDFEASLCEAISQVLDIENVGIKDDFFHLGGSSLKVMELLTLFSDDDFLSPSIIYKGRTVEGISSLYEEARSASLTPAEKEMEGRKRSFPLSRNMKWYWDNVNDASIDFYSCYQLNRLIPSSLLIKGLNNYIGHNSTFNLYLEEGEDGIPVQKYAEASPFIKEEKMSESEAQDEISHFVRPFSYREPLIRIRLLCTPLHSYLLFHAFHLVTDAVGVSQMLDDIISSIKGKTVKEVRYFAWAFDENRRDQSSLINNNREYFLSEYSMQDYEFSLTLDEQTNESGHGSTKAITIPLRSVQNHCMKEGISVQTFLSAAGLLAQASFNGTNKNNLCWNYNNRGPGENSAGVMARVAFCAIDRSAISTLRQLYAEITRQNEEQLGLLYEYDYYNDVTAEADAPAMTITYLEDRFSANKLPRILGKSIELPNTSPSNEQSEKAFVLIVTHEGKNLCIRFQYGKSYLTKEHAEAFLYMVKHAMQEIMCDRLPNFVSIQKGTYLL